MEIIELKRVKYEDKQTLGVLSFNNKEIAKTVELPWLNNNPKISCIPKGEYEVVRRTSAKYGNHFHITGVPKRDFILIHNANYHYQLLGCVAVGKTHTDINGDGYLDVTDSKNTMKKLLKELPAEFILKVI